MADAPVREGNARENAPDPAFDWRRIDYLVKVSRALNW
jgi:2-oxoisovalerate dehydrogenase E1 component